MSDTPTPRTDALFQKIALGQKVTFGEFRDIETELAAVTEQLEQARDTIAWLTGRLEAHDEAIEQRDDFKKEVEIANDRLRGKRHPDDNGLMVDGEIDVRQLIDQRDTARYYAERFRQNIHDIKPDNLLPLYLPWDSDPEINEYQSVVEQRDRLAEAMQEMWPFIAEDDYPNCNTPSFNAAISKYKQALQSLKTQNEP